MKYIVFWITMFSIIHTSNAQELLSQDVSYSYLEKLIAECKANYPKIKMYESRVTMAENGVKRAKLSYFDIFSLGYLYSPNNSTAVAAPTFLGGYQFGFFANIGSILQKPSMIRQAKGERSAAEFDKQAFDLNMEAEVKKRYFTYVQRLVILRAKSNTILDVESMRENLRHKFEKGEETLENYNKVLLMYADHTENIIMAESELLIAKSSLEELVGKKLEDIK